MPIEKLQPVQNLSGTKAFTQEVQIWNTNLKAVLMYSESFFFAQLTDLTQTLQKCEKQLHDMNQVFSKWEKKSHHKNCPTLKSAQKTANDIVKGEHIREIIDVKVTMKNQVPFISYTVDQNKLDKIVKQQLGRTLLITSRSSWSEEAIISAYRGLNRIESVFKHMKNREFLHWHPAFHWTDQKIHVHGLYCVLAVLLATLAHKKLIEQNVDITLLQMLEELSDIREVVVIHSETNGSKKKDEIIMSKMSPQQKKLAEILEINKYFIGTTKNKS